MKVSVQGQTFIAGLDWYSISLKEDIKEKKNELKEEGKKSGTIKISEDLYMVYAIPPGEENLPILATGFLWLSSGYYAMKLDDGGYWVFLKGKDGGIIHESVVSSIEQFNLENLRLLQRFSGEEGASSIEPKWITLKDARKFIRARADGLGATVKVALLAGGIIFLVAVVGLVVYTFLKPKPPPPPVVAPLPQPVEQPAPPPAVKYAELDLTCFEEFYMKALQGEQNPSCSKTFEEVHDTAKEKDCDSFARILSGIALRNGGHLQWGQRSENMLSFTYAGVAYARDLKPLAEYSYKSLTLSISGAEDAPSINFSGVVVCR